MFRGWTPAENPPRAAGTCQLYKNPFLPLINVRWAVDLKLRLRRWAGIPDWHKTPYTGEFGGRPIAGQLNFQLNPGPVTVIKMEEIKSSTKLDSLLGSKLEFKMPFQHWAHHRLTQHAGSYGYHFGDLAPMSIPHFTVQSADSILHQNVPLPLDFLV